MLEAVQVMHEANVVHTDLKPANFVLVKGRLKLIDFGISKAIANDTTNIGRDTQIGTVNYMPPEAFVDSGQGLDGAKLWKVRFFPSLSLSSFPSSSIYYSLLPLLFSLDEQRMFGHWAAFCTKWFTENVPSLTFEKRSQK